jgi:hypothetical protein
VDRLTRPGPAEREALALTKPAGTLWQRLRGELARLRREQELRAESWKMGGGTILAARWRHRQSTDIDLTTSASWQIAELGQSASNVFTETMGKLGGKLTGYRKGSIRMAFPDGKLHVYRVGPQPAAGHRVATIDGEPFEALSTTQILAGKLLNRLSETPARDLYDVVVAGRKDRDGLEQAVNMLDVETQAEAAFLWDSRQQRIEEDARETLRAISADEPLVVAPEELVEAAIRTIESSRYEKLEVESAKPGQAARVVTTTTGREPRRTAVPRTRIEEVLEETGLNQCLEARYVDIDWFIEQLHTEREQPTRPGGDDRVETPGRGDTKPDADTKAAPPHPGRMARGRVKG